MNRNHIPIFAAFLALLSSCASGLDTDFVDGIYLPEAMNCSTQDSESDDSAKTQGRVRIPKPIPPRTRQQTSGFCKMLFDVNSRGETRNIAANCSNPAFKKAAQRSVGEWEYNQADISLAVPYKCNVETIVTFMVADREGKPLPFLDARGNAVKRNRVAPPRR